MSVKWEILKEKANDECKKKNFAMAISLYTEAIKLEPNQDSMYSNRGLCYLTMKKYDHAKLDLNKAINLNSKNIKALKRLAHVHLTIGELSEAEIYLNRCVEVEPDLEAHRSDVEIVKSLKLMNEELNKTKFKLDFKTAEALAEKLLQKCRDCTRIKLIYLECLLNNCKAQKALEFIRNSLNEDEKRKEEFEFFLCLTYYHDGKYEKAKQILTTLIAKSNDSNIKKYNQLWETLKQIETEKDRANEQFKKGNYDTAIEMYTKLLELDNNNNTFNSTIYANRAISLQKKNKLFDALRDINKSIQLNENYAKAYYRRAVVNIALKNISKAKEDLIKVIQLDQNNRDAVVLLDDILREEKKATKRDFYKILDINRDATTEEIRKCYKKLAWRWHPDKNNESEEQKEHAEKKFQDINEAYNLLIDERKRYIYDSGEHPDNPDSTFHTDYKNQEETFDETFKYYSSTYKDNSESKSKSKKDQKKGYRRK